MKDLYRIFPKATVQQRAELKQSIDAVGLKNPPIVDEHKNVIDGHERRDVCEELGIDWLAGADVRIGFNDNQKKALAIEFNLWRRPIHLSRKKRNELIDIYLVAHPELSETQVAELFGVDQSTINRRRKKLMQMHKLSPVTATIGKDGVKRRVGKRGARLTVKSQKEFDSLVPDILEVGDDLQGLIRRPKRFASEARRKRRHREIEPVTKLPPQIEIQHCDWRDLEIEPQSVDLVLTDVLWHLEHRDDWRLVAERAKTWLKPDGLFASMIGQDALPYFYEEVMKHLPYLATYSVFMKQGARNWKGPKMIQRWRPVPVFGFRQRGIQGQDVLQSQGPEKEYGEYQQNLGVFSELVMRLSEPGALIVDPFLGTGTTAVACALLGEGKKVDRL